MPETTIVLLSMRQVQAALNIRSRSTIYDMVARKALPPPCVINRRGLRWRENDIRDWIASLHPRN
ncbi:MAG: helix-turn-helix transcriptional regulator [Novosphingobium sp.]